MSIFFSIILFNRLKFYFTVLDSYDNCYGFDSYDNCYGFELITISSVGVTGMMFCLFIPQCWQCDSLPNKKIRLLHMWLGTSIYIYIAI